MTEHKNHYRSLSAQGLWPAAAKSSAAETEIAGMRAELNKLQKTVGGNNGKTKLTPNNGFNGTCFICDKQGGIRRLKITVQRLKMTRMEGLNGRKIGC